MKVIVTGGCGFIGSHLVDELVKKNYEVHVIDDLSAVSNEKFYFNPKANYYKISIIEKEKIGKVFEGAKYVFHLAAESRIQTAIENPEYAYRINVLGTLCVLELCKEYKIERIVLSSTSSVYGMTERLPIKEDDNLDCLNPYSLSKYFSEQLCKQYSEYFDVAILRYFNVFGDRSPVKGQYAPVIGIFLDQYLNNKPLTIVGDGEQRRDFIHVSEVVSANIKSAESTKKFKGEIFNVGSGVNYSIKEIASFISKETVHIPQRPGEARNTLANVEKIKETLEFIPLDSLMSYIESKK
jgi:UDP-glucose 4-epimerase